MWLFSYGSNSPTQLAARLGRPLSESKAARLDNYWRVFRGYSRNWGGGTASVEPSIGSSVYGYVTNVHLRDLDVLDQYEGAAAGVYTRKKLLVDVNGIVGQYAIAYVHTSRTFNAPTKAYVEAVARTIGAFWRGRNGKINVNDIPIR